MKATISAILGHLGCVVWAGLIIASSGCAARSDRPNIIFVMADDLGYGDLGCYGQQKIRTPHLDRMAAEGIRFTQFYAGSTVCAPSRSCLMTGQHTGHTLVRGNSPRLPLRPEEVTVAKVLKQAGYTTGIIGKWGLGEPETTGIPNLQGFDEWFGYLNQKNAHNYYPMYLWKNQQKFPLEGNVADKGVATQRALYSHDLFTTEALNFIERHQSRPFFLYLPYTIPHANNEAKAKGMEVPSDAPYTDEPWPQAQKNHAAMITRLDRDMGRLFEKLDTLGIDDKTVVFFTSDNGPHKEGGADPNFFTSSGPLRGYKRALYEGGIRVPMIARWPGKIRPGRTSDHICALWDVLPTAADLADTPSPDNIDGISMLPSLLGGQQETHEFLYWEFHERGGKQAVRMGDWKAVRLKPGEPLELYNLKTDLGETDNLAAKHPNIVATFEACLAGARTESPWWPKRNGK